MTFRHPFMFYGRIVVEGQGYFVRRGVVELPEAVGRRTGWQPDEADDAA